ncbi:unnamed protein product, partial [Meganyctiphanes norvegica]
VQNSIQQHPGTFQKISKSWDLNQQLLEITKLATEKKSMQELGMLGRKSSNSQIGRTARLNKQLRNSMVSTQTCCEHCVLRMVSTQKCCAHCVLKTQQTQNPLLDVSTTSIKDLPGSASHSLSNSVEDVHILLRDSTESDTQDSSSLQKNSGSLKRMRSGLQPDVDCQSNLESSSPCQELSNSNISSSSIDATPQKRKGNQVKRRSLCQIDPNNIPVTVEEDVHFEIMLKKLMEDTSLHEKIAENINRGLSSSQSRGLQQSNSQSGFCSSEVLNTGESRIEKSGDNSTFPRELENIISNIASETTDSPDFEMILGEVFGSSLQKSANMSIEGVQNELSGIPARPLSTPIPHSQTVDNISNPRISAVYKENIHNENSSSIKGSTHSYKINQQDKMFVAKLTESSQTQNNQFRNETLQESNNAQTDHGNEVLNELPMKKTKTATTDDISITNMSSSSEKAHLLRSEMNVPHKLRHKFNRNSSSIQVNSNSVVTSQTDNLLVISSQQLEKNEERVHENFNKYISENKSTNNSLGKDMEQENNTKNLKQQNCANHMAYEIDVAEMKNTHDQVDQIDNESDSSRESLHIECSLPLLDKPYRVSDISNIPNKGNRDISKIASEVVEPSKNTSEDLLQITAPMPQKSILAAPDIIDVNEHAKQKGTSTNSIEVNTISTAELISRNTTPIKSMSIPGIATTLPVDQKYSPYKIIETNDSTLTELKSMRSNLSCLDTSDHWSPRLNTEKSPSRLNNLNMSNISIISSDITNFSENSLNMNNSTIINDFENNGSVASTPKYILHPVKELDNGYQLLSNQNTGGGTTLSNVQIIALPKNTGQAQSRQRYPRIATRPIAPRPIAPKFDANMSYGQKKVDHRTTNQDDTKDGHTSNTPLIKLPFDTVICPAIESINPSAMSTFKLANNVTFTIPNIPSVMSIPNQNAKIQNSDENNRNSPIKPKSPKSPIRGRVVNMTRVKNKKGVGKAGKRKLRAQKELENMSKSNELVSAAVALSLSASPTKKQSPSKETDNPSDSKIKDSSNKIVQDDKSTLGYKESERNSEKNVILGSVSPKLKELLQISKNIGSGKKKKSYSVHKSPIHKGLPSRGSQSTPSHKNSHIRALDFGTPGKDISPRKLRKQQVMQSLNFSPRLSFKKTLKSSTLDDSSSKLCNIISPKKRILERIQEETNDTLSKKDFISSERMEEHETVEKKSGRRKNKSTVSKKKVNTIISKVNPLANVDNVSNKSTSSNNKMNKLNKNKDEENSLKIVTNPLSNESIHNSVNEKLSGSLNTNLMLETPFKTNDILTLELATPFVKSVKHTCDNEEDLNTPFPRIPEDLVGNSSPKIDKTSFCTPSVLSSHYQPGIIDQNVIDFPKTVSQHLNTKNHNKEKIQKKNTESKKKNKQKNITGIKMGKKIEEEIASRFGSPNSTELQTETLVNISNHSKESSLQYHDIKTTKKKETKKILNNVNDSKISKRKQKSNPCKESIVIEKVDILSHKDKETHKKITRLAIKQDNTLCITEEKLGENFSSRQKITEDNENTEKETHKVIEQPCDNIDSLRNRNDVSKKLEKLEKNYESRKYTEKLDQTNGSDESSGESSKWRIDDESPEIKSRIVESIEDQGCDEYPRCKYINSEIDENDEYIEEETFTDLNLAYSEYIDLFSLNLTVENISKKRRLNKRLWIEGSSKWSPKHKRPRIRNHGSPSTSNIEELTSMDGESELQEFVENLKDEENQMELPETMVPQKTPVRGSLSERSVGSSVSSSSPGRLVILHSPHWKLDDTVMTNNPSLVGESKEESSQSSESAFIAGIESLKSASHQVSSCMKCNKEVQNGSICVCENSDEQQKSFSVDENTSSESSSQNQQRSKKAKHISKVLSKGGTFEIAQSPTKQMAIVTEPQITEIKVPSVEVISEESNASIIPPTPGKNLDLGLHGISTSNSHKSESNSSTLRQIPKAPETMTKISNAKKYSEYDVNSKSVVNTFSEIERKNHSSDDNSTPCIVNPPKQYPSLLSPQKNLNNSDESQASLTLENSISSSAENISTIDISEGELLTNQKKVTPKKKIKLVKKMNIEEFLKNVHK